MYQFRNDYSFGAHPKVLEAILSTNLEGLPGYGGDSYCVRATRLIRELCQAPQADVQFFIGGTSTNFTAIAAFLRPWEGVICAASGHINGHEAGAVEATGHKIIPLPAGTDGKITAGMVEAALPPFEHTHTVRPGWSTSPTPPRPAASTPSRNWKLSPAAAGNTTSSSSWTAPGWAVPSPPRATT